MVLPGDPETAANAVIKFLSNKRLRRGLINNGLETAKKFTWDRVTDVFEEAIRG